MKLRDSRGHRLIPASRRRTAHRVWLASTFVMLLAVVAFAPVGLAQTSGSVADARPDTEGWWIDRPPESDQLFNPALPAGGAASAYPENHLYVGWNPAPPTPRASHIFAINYDPFQRNIPDKATFLKFSVVVLEHPQNNDRSTPNRSDGYTQGIVACAIPDFLSGVSAMRLYGPNGAPDRDCSSPVRGVRGSAPVNPTEPATAHVFPWTFDLTSMANSLHQDSKNLSFSFEPALAARSQNPWTLSFHGGDYKEPDTARPGQNIDKPGVLATIEWSGGSDDPLLDAGIDFGSDFSSDLGTGGDFPSFGDTESLASGLAPEPPPAPRPRGVAGAIAGRSADFWDISAGAWLLMVAALGLLSFSGWALQLAPPPRRAPGAADALMRGGSNGSV